jgi:lipopolysaccharide transport system permease protein
MSTSVEIPKKVEPELSPSPAGEPATPPETFIRPKRRWQLLNVRELWQFRELIYFLTWRDVKIRYKQTVLGAAWAVLQPAMMMVVFSIFFGHIAGVPAGDLPYPLFVYAGLLPWTFFATAVSNASNSVIGSERLITKIYFPRLAVPFASVGAAVVDFAIALGLLFLLMLYYGVMPGVGLLLLPVLYGVILLAALGVGTLLAALNVAYRDFRYVVPFLVQVWMFATPTVYMELAQAGSEGGAVQFLLSCNPLTGLVAAFRAACLGGAIPWEQFGVASAVCAALFLAGCFYFRKVEDNFADII